MNDSLSCEQVVQQLTDALPGADAASAEALLHLRHCARCTREWNGLRDLSRSLGEQSEPSWEDVAEARLGLRRLLAEEANPLPRAAAVARRERLLLSLRPFFVRAASFLVTLGLLIPIASSLSPLSSTAEESAGASTGLGAPVDEVWQSVRSHAEELKVWTPRLGLDEWFGMIPGRANGMLPEIPPLPSAIPSRSG